MKLATFEAGGRVRVGAVSGSGDSARVVDLNAAAELLPDGPPHVADTLQELLAAGVAGLGPARAALAAALAEDGPGAAGVVFPLAAVTWLPPVLKPQKILAIGLNYRDHCEEQGLPAPTILTLFNKFPSSLNAAGAPIVLPPADVTTKVDYEAELAVVIGRGGRNIAEADAYQHVGGYTCCNDVSARDVQKGDGGGQWVHGKSFDTFAPLGPWIVTPDEISDPHVLEIQSRLNGEVMQSSNTRHLVFRIPYLLAELSRCITLLPGDVITTGTPGGVGMHRTPPTFLQPGDTITIGIEGIGELTNLVVAAEA